MTSWDLAVVLGGIGLGLAIDTWRRSTVLDSVRPATSAAAKSPHNIDGSDAAPTIDDTAKIQPLPLANPVANPSEPNASALGYWAAIELAQFKGSFLARTAHELRSPLNGLISSLQMIQADLCDSPEEEREYIGMAHDAALKFVGLLDEVIGVSKVQWGSRPLKPEAIDLDLLLQEIAYLIHLQAQNRNLKVHFPELEDDISISGDRQCLQQAMTILVDIPLTLLQEGNIYIDCQIVDQHAQITIQDDRAQADWETAIAILKSPADFADLQSPAASQPSLPQLSPTLRLLIAKELLMANQASLAIVQEADRPQLRCLIPLASI
ncbi:sensor histidine kinase [Alkalinema pantanalense CENA528]|uniref:sensor histidine kinase n=1 Tax=Alkalinema pantanalense TaxID=1620705 RepID=UPI003D6DD83D